MISQNITNTQLLDKLTKRKKNIKNNQDKEIFQAFFLIEKIYVQINGKNVIIKKANLLGHTKIPDSLNLHIAQFVVQNSFGASILIPYQKSFSIHGFTNLIARNKI
jgi:hypothetical protein